VVGIETGLEPVVTALPGWDLRPALPFFDDRQPAILLLEDNRINQRVIRGTLKDEGYRILDASRAAEAFELLRTETIDLVVADLMMPGVGGLEFCRAMKSNRQTRLIPVLILTSVQGPESEIAGIASGADEFLVKPLNPDILRTRVRAMLRHKAAIDSLEESEAILFSLAQAIEHRDNCTSGHCERLSALATSLGLALGLTNSQLLALHRGGYLHDIGKVAVPDAILFKPGPLTPEEWVLMREHTIHGEDICRPARTLGPVLPIIRSHHERWDGSGYPDRLKGEKIPLLARVLQTADIFDALTSVRPYKPALTAVAALEILEEETKRGWRDPRLVSLLRRVYESGPGAAAEEGLAPWPPDQMLESLEKIRKAVAG
jgi:putative two-component system response regulator